MYTITTKSSSLIVQLYFTTFSLQSDVSCSRDYIKTYDGDSNNSPLLNSNSTTQGRLCGKRSPFVVFSTGQSLTVWFQSDKSIGGEGFSASWKFVPKMKGIRNLYF